MSEVGGTVYGIYDPYPSIRELRLLGGLLRQYMVVGIGGADHFQYFLLGIQVRIGKQIVMAFELDIELFPTPVVVPYYTGRFVGGFDANCYLYLSHAMDLFDIADHGAGSLEAGMRLIDARRALVAGVTTDWLFPVSQQREIAELLKGAGVDVSIYELESIQGHDSFLIDHERFAPMVEHFLRRDMP